MSIFVTSAERRAARRFLAFGCVVVLTVASLLALAGVAVGLDGGTDQFNSELTNLQVQLLTNPGCPWPVAMTCEAGTLVGPTTIERDQALVDNSLLIIPTEVISIEMSGLVECRPLGPAWARELIRLPFKATAGTSSLQGSFGQIRTDDFYAGPASTDYPSPPSPSGCGAIVPPESCALQSPAYSFFDIFVQVDIDVLPGLDVSLASQDAIRMQANINHIPPYRRPGIFLPYEDSGWVLAEDVGQHDATIHELPLKLYYQGNYCANLISHPNHAPVGPVPTVPPPLQAVVINEFMPNPRSDWNRDAVIDDQDEYIELYNRNDLPVDLSGWQLDDAEDVQGLRESGDKSPAYTIPQGTTIPVKGFLVFFRSQTGIELDDDGDTVRLLLPGGAVVDQHTYAAARVDTPFSRAPDGAGGFSEAFRPTPGSGNQTIRISLNEFMPNPGNPFAKQNEEYIELYNGNGFPFDLGGWTLDDVDDGAKAGSLAPDGSPAYVIPVGTMIPAHGYLAFPQSQTGIELDDAGDMVRLLLPDGFLEQMIAYSGSQPGLVYARIPDGTGDFFDGIAPSFGLPNPQISSICPDFDDSGDIGLEDIVAVAGLWNSIATSSRFDRDSDGRVTVIDIERIAGGFGAPCSN